MDVRVDIDIDVSEATALINRMERRMLSYRPVFTKARSYLEREYGANFATRGVLAEGSPWAAYGKWSAEAGQPARLFRTGRLMESLTNLRGAPNDIGLTSATFGTNVPYAEYHQYGTPDMASRKIVFTPFGFANMLARETVDHLIPESDPAAIKADI